MKAAYLKAPRQFEVRDVELRPISEEEVLVDVKACGFCGHDNIRSRRIDDANRIVYRVVRNELELLQCGGHYRD